MKYTQVILALPEVDGDETMDVVYARTLETLTDAMATDAMATEVKRLDDDEDAAADFFSDDEEHQGRRVNRRAGAPDAAPDAAHLNPNDSMYDDPSVQMPMDKNKLSIDEDDVLFAHPNPNHAMDDDLSVQMPMDEDEALYRKELHRLIQQLLSDAALLAEPILNKVANLGEGEVLTDEDDDALAILNHVYYHCEVLLRRPDHAEYDPEVVRESAEQLAILSQLVSGFESVNWQRFGKFLGLVAVVAVLGVMAVTPIGGASLVTFLGGLALHGMALAVATYVPLAGAVIAGTSGFFADKKGKKPTGLSKSILEVSKNVPEEDDDPTALNAANLDDRNADFAKSKRRPNVDKAEENGDLDDAASVHSY